MNKEKIYELASIINESKYLVFLGGAGVSTESQIPDFRSSGGLYAKKYPYPAETMLSRSFFYSRTEEFFDFYKNNMIYMDAKPNAAHLALALFEKNGPLKATITQNIDGLHQQAGAVNVLELHGSVYRNYCIKCRKPYSVDFILESKGIPVCDCGGIIKPDVVLYEESLDDRILESSVKHLQAADTLIIGGTSLNVYPAASLINYFYGKNLVIINKSETPGDHLANLVINESIGNVLNAVINISKVESKPCGE